MFVKSKNDWACSCDGKTAYTSRHAADVALRVLFGRKGKFRYTSLNVYRCRYCSMWHLGRVSQMARKKKRIKEIVNNGLQGHTRYADVSGDLGE